MIERFARQELVPGWDQTALEVATVVIVGVGALGNEVARLLAMSGVRRLVLCDPDMVAVSNLSRTVLFRDRAVGRLKVEAARATLSELAPSCEVDCRPLPLVSGVGLAELRDASLVVSCLDSRAARLQLAMRCNLVNAAMLDAGTSSWGGEVRIYRAGGPCYGCGLSRGERSVRDDPWSCTAPLPTPDAAASAPVSALVGAWLVLFALRLLLRLSVPGDVLHVDAGAGTARWVEHASDGSCPAHDRIPTDSLERLAIGDAATVSALVSCCEPDELVLAWTEFRHPGTRAPSIVVNRVPAQTRLRDLGIAPREILPVVRDRHIRYVELARQPGREGCPS
jgi:molybdopterin/thiamine biosynthesis adenylyltransferase